MSNSYTVTYWRKHLRLQNFGDYLSEVLLQALCRRSIFDPGAGHVNGRYEFIYLIGSAIDDHHVKIGLEHAQSLGPCRIAFWCCGKRDEHPLDQELLGHCVFLGARGPLTRDALGLPSNTPLGDPALLLPIIYTPKFDKEWASKTICVPHFNEKKSDEELLVSTGVDVILRPNITNELNELFRFIDRLVSARFAICGALHAAIVRCAYATEFAYFDSGDVDVPFKWKDFSASVGIGARFAKSLAEGQSIYAENISNRVRIPRLDGIVAAAPLAPPRALRQRAKAWQFDTVRRIN